LRYSDLIIRLSVCAFLSHYFLFYSVAHGEEPLEESVDCTDVSVHYSNDPTLTQEERLRLMDEALVSSLNRFELCQKAGRKNTDASSGNTNGSGSSGEHGSTGDSGNGTGEGIMQSVASPAMSGTEVPKVSPPTDEFETAKSQISQASLDNERLEAKTGAKPKMVNGKIPEDIPPAANDDTLAAQIRYAAENESDPIKRKQLWNEYRKYKGLATKE